MNTYYWLVSIVCTILFVRPVPVVYAEESNRINEVNEKNELVQNESAYIADIHENTLIYNGKLAPKLTLSLSIRGQEEKTVDIPVASSGNFIIDFSQYTIKVGDKLIFNVTGNGKESFKEQIEKVVLEKSPGAEIILSTEDTPQEKEFETVTTLSDIYTHTKEVSGKTALDTAVYLVSEGQMTKPIYSDSITGAFNWVFDKNQTERQVGESLQFVFVSNGMMTVLERTVLKPTKEWEMRIAEIRKATILPNVYQEMKSYLGKTIPNSKIKGTYLNQILFEVVSDKEGNFTFDDQALSDIPIGKVFFLTITDSEGVYLSIEKNIYPKKELVEKVEQKPEPDSETEEDNHDQVSSENNTPKPFIKEDKDKIVSVLPIQPEESSSQGSTEDSTNVIIESEVSETKASLGGSLETETDKADETSEKEEVEGSDFVILATIVLIGTLTMSGLLYKY
ncbi:hypothetical protein [Carnobacterium funditum]|uniref:hypothetical protein n=1 Tax=Carnobacterium funditum TaxID=2752 RepID=UPI0012EB4D9E|nr:hypothetical protein [Carnobacterium funditum]